MAITACLTEAVAAIVRHQAEAGIDVVSDGEFGKSISWSQYALETPERLRNAARSRVGANPFQRGADRRRFAEFYAELDAREEIATSTDRGFASGRSRIPDRPSLERDNQETSRLRSTASKSRRRSCQSLRPASVIPGSQERVLPQRRGLPRRHPAAAMRTEYKMIVRWPASCCSSTTRAHRGNLRTAWCRRRASPSTATGSPSTSRCSITRSRACRPSASATHVLLGKLAGTAHHRRAAQGHPRSHPPGEGRGPT